MTTVLIVLTIWFLGLTAFVALKLRQPKWEYPKPPRAAEANWRREAA